MRLSPTNRGAPAAELMVCESQVPICSSCFLALHILERTANRSRVRLGRHPGGDQIWAEYLQHALDNLPPQV